MATSLNNKVRNTYRTRHALMLFALNVSLLYLTYRVCYTFNTENTWFWVLFYITEVQGVITFALFCFDTWTPIHPEHKPASEGLSVDVFICTYNEDEELLRKTVLGAESMTYPHTTYLLDDGKRENIKQLALSLGVQYITRPDNKGAKAGNINNALKNTNGDFIAILDADHIPLSDFLERQLGYFDDPAVAFVQSPQTFYNIDAIEEDVDFENGEQSEQAEIFFHLIMPGKNRWNSAYFCGTGGIFRRKALLQVGGFAAETITEDIHTSIKIHNLGGKSVYVAEHLASGLAPSDLANYHVQRTRWAIGNLRVMFCCNLFKMSGLTLAQKISYLNSMLYWTCGLRKLIFYITPILILLFGIYPAANLTTTLIVLFMLNISVQLATFKIITHGRGVIFNEEFYNMMNFWVFTSAFFRACFKIGAQKFVTTDKSEEGDFVPMTSIKPHIIFVVVSIVAIVFGMLKVRYAIDIDTTGAYISIFWCFWNMCFAVMVIWLAIEPMASESKTRFFDYIPLLYKDELSTTEKVAITKEYGDDGLQAFFSETMDIGRQIDATLILRSFRLPIKMKIANEIKAYHSKMMKCYELTFIDIDRNCIDILNTHTMLYTVPRMLDYLGEKGSKMLSGGLFKWAWLVLYNKKKRTDFPINMDPMHNTWAHCRTVELLSDRATIISDHPLTPGYSDLMIATPLGYIRGKANILNNDLQEYHGIPIWKSNIEFEPLDDKSRETVRELINA